MSNKDHDLKCLQPYFADVRNGVKDFEVRLNDRNFQVGDTIHLHEIRDDETKTHAIHGTLPIKYILQGGQFGIEPGYVVLGFGVRHAQDVYYLQKTSKELAMMALQSDRYTEDHDYRQAVDAVLAMSREVIL